MCHLQKSCFPCACQETTARTYVKLCIAAHQLYLHFVEFPAEQVLQLPQLSDLPQLHAVRRGHWLIQHLLRSNTHVICIELHLCCVFHHSVLLSCVWLFLFKHQLSTYPLFFCKPRIDRQTCKSHFQNSYHFYDERLSNQYLVHSTLKVKCVKAGAGACQWTTVAFILPCLQLLFFFFLLFKEATWSH